MWANHGRLIHVPGNVDTADEDNISSDRVTPGISLQWPRVDRRQEARRSVRPNASRGAPHTDRQTGPAPPPVRAEVSADMPPHPCATAGSDNGMMRAPQANAPGCAISTDSAGCRLRLWHTIPRTAGRDQPRLAELSAGADVDVGDGDG
jgi:hypothetical protein